MFNHTWSTLLAEQPEANASNSTSLFFAKIASQPRWLFGGAVFLVSVPVFIEAPLVRYLPLVSLIVTGGWVWLGLMLMSHRHTEIWGDLLLGFSGSWLAGSLYWGCMRWEPLLHLPIEAIGLPMAIWCIQRRQWLVGSWFYLGSITGTAVTDLYFYLVDLMDHWRQLMRVEPELALPIMQSAVSLVKTPWGVGCAVVLGAVLLVIGFVGLGLGMRREKDLHWWGFSGAVLSTILVDSLFFLAAN